MHIVGLHEHAERVDGNAQRQHTRHEDRNFVGFSLRCMVSTIVVLLPAVSTPSTRHSFGRLLQPRTNMIQT